MVTIQSCKYLESIIQQLSALPYVTQESFLLFHLSGNLIHLSNFLLMVSDQQAPNSPSQFILLATAKARVSPQMVAWQLFDDEER